MDKKLLLTVEQWVALYELSLDGAGQIPVWFQVTGGCIMPFVRPFLDDVMIVAVKKEALKVGDIVLFQGKYAGGDYCLHRFYRIDGDRVQIFGDGNLRPVLLLPFGVMNKLHDLYAKN